MVTIIFICLVDLMSCIKWEINTSMVSLTELLDTSGYKLCHVLTQTDHQASSGVEVWVIQGLFLLQLCIWKPFSPMVLRLLTQFIGTWKKKGKSFWQEYSLAFLGTFFFHLKGTFDLEQPEEKKASFRWNSLRGTLKYLATSSHL